MIYLDEFINSVSRDGECLKLLRYAYTYGEKGTLPSRVRYKGEKRTNHR